MKIDRHNYEEYFILYMDNELGSDERRMVEAFIQQHPDLKEELDLLNQYKLTPDTNIVFANKEELLKANDESTISVSNYEEWLILYIDNELTAEQNVSVENFIAANPFVQNEFNLLQRTQLQAEEIIFTDKASLYRTEEKVRPLPVRWWRIAAAAVLLLGVGITTAVVINKKTTGTEAGIVKGNDTKKKTTPVNPVVVPKEQNNAAIENAVADNNSNQDLPQAVKKDDDKNVTVKEKRNAVKNPLPANTNNIAPQKIKEEVAVVNNKPTNELPQPVNNPNINKNENNNAVASNNPKENKQQEPLTKPVVTNKDASPSDIQTASYTNNKNDDAELDQPNDKKNKNRGFFRKIARTFEKRTSIDATDDDKLLVGGLAIRLK